MGAFTHTLTPLALAATLGLAASMTPSALAAVHPHHAAPAAHGSHAAAAHVSNHAVVAHSHAVHVVASRMQPAHGHAVAVSRHAEVRGGHASSHAVSAHASRYAAEPAPRFTRVHGRELPAPHGHGAHAQQLPRYQASAPVRIQRVKTLSYVRDRHGRLHRVVSERAVPIVEFATARVPAPIFRTNPARSMPARSGRGTAFDAYEPARPAAPARAFVDTRPLRATSAPEPQDTPEQTSAPSSTEPITVHHDRKQHFAPAPQSAQPTAPVAYMGNSLTTQPLISRQDILDDEVSHPAATANATPALQMALADPDADVQLVYSHGRLVMPAAMKGSHEILIHQNVMADQDGLERVQDDFDLERLRSSRMLVPLPVSEGLLADERLPLNRRYARPWTAQFLQQVARAHYRQFHTALQVNSAVRTVDVQLRLLRTNGNAAPAAGDTASPHLTGQAVDIGKRGLTMTEIAWLRGYLLPLVQQGKIDVEEEFQQACFHISVYRRYLPQAVPPRTIQQQRSPAPVLATAFR